MYMFKPNYFIKQKNKIKPNEVTTHHLGHSPCVMFKESVSVWVA